MEFFSDLVNYGALGIMVMLLVFGIRVLYKRNCGLSDILTDLVGKNTEAMNRHIEAIDGLKEIIKERKL